MYGYIRKGYCSMCGECCNIKNFKITDQMQANNSVKFDKDGFCTDFNKATKKCSIYGTRRPYPCCVFPRHPKDIETLPMCTFYFIKKGDEKNEKSNTKAI